MTPDQTTEAPDAAAERIALLRLHLANRCSSAPDEITEVFAHIDALTARCEQAERREAGLREALEDVRARVHVQTHGGYVVGATPADQCYRWVCDVVNQALLAAVLARSDQEDTTTCVKRQSAIAARSRRRRTSTTPAGGSV